MARPAAAASTAPHRAVNVWDSADVVDADARRAEGLDLEDVGKGARARIVLLRDLRVVGEHCLGVDEERARIRVGEVQRALEDDQRVGVPSVRALQDGVVGRARRAGLWRLRHHAVASECTSVQRTSLEGLDHHPLTTPH